MSKIGHFEIAAKDPEKTKAFYENVFGWRITDGDMVMDISSEEAGMSGHILKWPHDHPTYVSFYIDVPDVQAHLEKATAQGATVIVPATPIPGGIGGIMGMFLDPEGHPIGLMQKNA